MESIKYQGWDFTFDKASTREYYTSHRDNCTCASCRNFHKNINEMPLDVRAFLKGLELMLITT